MSVKIVVDSTADIGRERAARHGLTMVPQTIILGDEQYQDGVDLDAVGLFERIKQSGAFPRTSAPSVGQFESTYRELAREAADGILSVHISAELSATFNTARLAAEAVSNETAVEIRVVDSRTSSIGYGLPALLTADFAERGGSLDEVAQYFQRTVASTRTFVAFDTLEYLLKGGRLGKSSALIGTLLNVKPILTLRDGGMVPVARERSRARQLSRLVSLLREYPALEYIGIAATDEHTVEELNGALLQVDAGHREDFLLSPGICIHTGPRAGVVCAMLREREGDEVGRTP